MSAVLADVRRAPVEPSQRQEFRPDIQGLRAIAVGLVVLAHAGVSMIAGGFVGVDVFFVISGFLITGLLLADARSGRVSFSAFYARRARRILPAATLVIIATAVASVYLLNFVLARDVLTDSVWASFFAANLRFGGNGTDYFSHDAVSPMQHFWSLALEEQFYLVWPALLAVGMFGLSRRRARSRGRAHRRLNHPKFARRRVLLLLSLLATVSLAQSIHETATHPAAAYFSTFARAWELAAGALLAVGLPSVQRLPVGIRTVLTWSGLLGIVVAAVRFDEQTPFPGTAALLPVLSTCALLAGGVGSPGHGANRLLERRPMRFLGDISYSLYLWHWPLLILGAEYAGHALSTAQNLALVLVAVALSTVSYYAIENPMRRSKRLWGPNPRRALALWPAAFATVVLFAVLARPVGPIASGAPVAAAGPNGSATSAVAAVQAAVAAADRDDPIPHELSPSFDALRGDFKSIGDCSGYRKTRNKLCQLGDPAGTKTLVLFGNSHATMWVPAMSAIAKAAGWRFIPVVKEACDYGEFLGSPRNLQCGMWYQWAIRQIERVNPDLIVMGGDRAGPDWQSAIAQAMVDMKSRSSRVILMSQAPGVSRAPFACLLKRGATLGDCSWPAAENRVAADQTQSTVAKQTGVEFLNVRQWFCYRHECPTVIANIVAYADVGHITATYARYLIPDLAPLLRLT